MERPRKGSDSDPQAAIRTVGVIGAGLLDGSILDNKGSAFAVNVGHIAVFKPVQVVEPVDKQLVEKLRLKS